jgi:adenine-specific DNA-methyltransferase
MDIPEDRNMIEKICSEVGTIFVNQGKEKAYNHLQVLIKRYCAQYNITWLKNYCNIDENGRIYFAKDLSTPGKPRVVDIPSINLHLDALPTRGWPNDSKIIELYDSSRLVFKGQRPYVKHYIQEAQDNAPSILNFYSRHGTLALKKLGIHKLFDTPKPVELIKFFIRLCCKTSTYILDYFAGSGTTAQAVYEINKEDKMKHNYILVQLNEKVNSKSDVYTECEKLGIKPQLQYILKYRIDTYLELNNQSIDYDFYDE